MVVTFLLELLVGDMAVLEGTNLESTQEYQKYLIGLKKLSKTDWFCFFYMLIKEKNLQDVLV